MEEKKNNAVEKVENIIREKQAENAHKPMGVEAGQPVASGFNYVGGELNGYKAENVTPVEEVEQKNADDIHRSVTEYTVPDGTAPYLDLSEVVEATVPLSQKEQKSIAKEATKNKRAEERALKKAERQKAQANAL